MSRNLIAFACFAGCLALGSTTASAAGPDGIYTRPNGTTAKVWTCSGKLCATVQESKFSMFLSGIAPAGEGTWKGDMKHPDMPGFMTFNGTVKTTPKGLSVQGCAMGQSMCDAETWTKQ